MKKEIKELVKKFFIFDYFLFIIFLLNITLGFILYNNISPGIGWIFAFLGYFNSKYYLYLYIEERKMNKKLIEKLKKIVGVKKK